MAATVMLLDRKPRAPVATCAARKVWKKGLTVLVVSNAGRQGDSPEGVGKVGLLDLLEVGRGALVADAADVLFPRGLETAGVPAGEHRHHEPARTIRFAFALRQVLVVAQAKVERVGEVQGVLRARPCPG